jgi:hypothetical protein
LEQSGAGGVVEATAVGHPEPLRVSKANLPLKANNERGGYMLRRKKLISEIKRTESVANLSNLIVRARLQPAGFELDPSLWEDASAEDLMVLQTLVAQLRELIEESELDPDAEDHASRGPDYDP